MEARTLVEREEQADELLAHADALLRYALPRVGERATAEDLVQETLVTAVAQRSGFAGASTMRTWLIGILRHKLVDHYRWRQRHPSAQDAVGDEPAPDMEPWFTPRGAWRADPNEGLDALDGDPSKDLERAQLRVALQHCVDHLPPALHRVFVLRELEDLDPDTACEVAGIARESLAVFLYRARQSLRACLQRKWVES